MSSFVRVLASVVSVASLVALSTGCSGIRVVQRTQTGGIVALQGAQDDARLKADEYMRSQCPGGYEVVEEGEAVVGSQTTAQTSRPGRFGSTTSATSQDVREWRITYKCKGAETAAQLQTVIVQF